MRPKLRVWITFGDDVKFGDGRARLLELIEARGSLNKAAEELEMSYRNAWGYLKDLERAAGFDFVERAPGRGPRSGMRLTARGKRFLARYRKFRTVLDSTVERQFTKVFTHAVRSGPRTVRSEPRAVRSEPRAVRSEPRAVRSGRSISA